MKRVHVLQLWLGFEDPVQRFLQLSDELVLISMEDATVTIIHRKLAEYSRSVRSRRWR